LNLNGERENISRGRGGRSPEGDRCINQALNFITIAKVAAIVAKDLSRIVRFKDPLGGTPEDFEIHDFINLKMNIRKK